MNSKVYILLPAHNRKAVTERFIDCLAAQTCRNYHLILIDDGSVDGTAGMVKAKIGQLTVLKGEGSWWWAGSLQQGINWLHANQVPASDVVIFANDDITFEPDFLLKALKMLGGLSRTLILPQVLNDETGLVEESGVEANLHKFTFKTASSAARINCLTTRGLIMRMEDLDEIGNFHPSLLPHYWSDYEFTIRAYRKGLGLITSPALFISYDKHQTGYREFGNLYLKEFFRQYFSKRSVVNPVYQSTFILLACPWRYAPRNLAGIWKVAVTTMLHQIKRSLKDNWLKYRIQHGIKKLRENLKIIVGAEATSQKGWVSTNYPLLDVTNRQSYAALFAAGTVSNFLAEHVWEHLTAEEAEQACQNTFEFLKRGGRLRIAVPDGFHESREYIAQVKPGGKGEGAADHKVLYNYRMLAAMLERAGYNIRLLEWFDEYGKFHFESWDAADGFVLRSTRFDPRNRTKATAYTSLIIDAVKP